MYNYASTKRLKKHVFHPIPRTSVIPTSVARRNIRYGLQSRISIQDNGINTLFPARTHSIM